MQEVLSPTEEFCRMTLARRTLSRSGIGQSTCTTTTDNTKLIFSKAAVGLSICLGRPYSVVISMEGEPEMDSGNVAETSPEYRRAWIQRR